MIVMITEVRMIHSTIQARTSGKPRTSGCTRSSSGTPTRMPRNGNAARYLIKPKAHLFRREDACLHVSEPSGKRRSQRGGCIAFSLRQEPGRAAGGSVWRTSGTDADWLVAGCDASGGNTWADTRR